jgi:uncharacterized membrane protein YqiK
MSDPAPIDEERICELYLSGLGYKKIQKETGVRWRKQREILTAHGIAIRKSPHTSSQEVNKAETERRVLLVLSLMNKGGDRHSITAYVNKETKNHKPAWNVTIATVDTYMTAARKIRRAAYEQEQADLLAEADAIDRYLYTRALGNDDIKTAAHIHQDWKRTRNLYPAAKVEHSGTLTWKELIQIAHGEAPPS